MPILTNEELEFPLPKMVKVRQKFYVEQIEDVEKSVYETLNNQEIKSKVKSGQKIAVTVGSRGIRNLDTIVKTTIEVFKDLGAKPFIVPAMGSHGGATGKGQIEVLKNYGVTEEAMGVKICSSTDVVQIGETRENVPVYMDEYAYNADMVVVINRVKPHTDFRGEIESGLCKMMAIGLGNYKGCSRLHQEGLENFTELIPEVAKFFIEKANIGLGLAIVENSYDETAIIQAIPVEKIMEEEPKLLAKAKEMMPKILLPEIDVLLVEELGKDITGSGMDTNVIGRTRNGKTPNFDGPDIKRIVVLDLTEVTHGNAAGIGLAEFTTKKVFDKLDYDSTYKNVIAAGNPDVGRIPLIMEDEKEATIAAIKCCCKIDYSNPKIVKIKDTLHLSEIYVSEALLDYVKNSDDLEIIDEQ